MKGLKWILNVILILVLLLTSCSGEETAEVSLPTLLDPVSTSESENTIVVKRMELYSGNLIQAVVVPQMEELYFSLEGQIVSIDVIAGQEVEEGEVLATINQTVLKRQIDDLQNEIFYLESSYDLQIRQAEIEKDIAKRDFTELQSQYDAQEYEKVQENIKANEAESKAQIAENAQEGAVEDPGMNSKSEENEQNEQQSMILPEQSEPEQIRPEITLVDLQLAELSWQEAELSYLQLLEAYNLEMSQRQEELQLLTAQLGDDTLTAPFAGRVVEVYGAAGSYVTKDTVIMLIVNENKKMLRGEAFYNTTLKSIKNLDAVINNEVFELSYIPYDDLEYVRRIDDEEILPTWFTFECPDYIDFGDRALVRAYDQYNPDALVVPSDCIQTDDLGQYVYKEEEGSRVRKYVTLGIISGNYTEILSGLKEGDEVYGIE